MLNAVLKMLQVKVTTEGFSFRWSIVKHNQYNSPGAPLVDVTVCHETPFDFLHLVGSRLIVPVPDWSTGPNWP